MNVERDVLRRLDRAGVGYYVTGSEALSVWAEPRQTLDIDIVTDLAQAPRSRVSSRTSTGRTSNGSPTRWGSRYWWSGSVAIDSDQVLLDRRLIEAGLEGRRAAHARLRAKGFARVWAQSDRAGEMTELELARFLLRRLYPDLEGERLDAIMTRLEAEWHAGTWTGFVRPRAGR